VGELREPDTDAGDADGCERQEGLLDWHAGDVGEDHDAAP
jgi:hypothetical protein